MTPSNHPLWALKHKRPGIELRLINGKYYLYEYKTIYDKIKKRPKKLSGSILGSITQKEGLVTNYHRSGDLRQLGTFLEDFPPWPVSSPTIVKNI